MDRPTRTSSSSLRRARRSLGVCSLAIGLAMLLVSSVLFESAL